MYWIRNFMVLATALLVEVSGAVEKAQVLPKGVNYASLRLGMMDRMGEIYGPSGGLSFRGDTFGQEFNLAKIRSFASSAQKAELDKLVQALEAVGGRALANQVTSGRLEFDVDPSIRYTVPIYARGITDRLTVGIALPIVNYKMDIQARQEGSTIPQIKQEMNAFASNSQTLRDGLDRLDNLVSTFMKTAEERGYKKIQSREDNFLGDIQLVGMYHLLQMPQENMVIKTGLILPTGPKDDADDLTDLDNQHQTAVGLGVINDYNLSRRLTWGAGTYFLARLPDRSTHRVPLDRGDALPNYDRKENLERNLGDSLSANTNMRYQINDYFEVAAGYEIGTKSPDSYQGNNNWDYSILSDETYQTWNKSVLALEYSTVSGFLGGRDTVPLTITYDFSDIFAGTNIERQQVHEVGFRLYF